MSYGSARQAGGAGRVPPMLEVRRKPSRLPMLERLFEGNREPFTRINVGLCILPGPGAVPLGELDKCPRPRSPVRYPEEATRGIPGGPIEAL
jgi:hypothetical protein